MPGGCGVCLQLQPWKVGTGDQQSKLPSKTNYTGKLWFLNERPHLNEWHGKMIEDDSWIPPWVSACKYTNAHTYAKTHMHIHSCHYTCGKMKKESKYCCLWPIVARQHVRRQTAGSSDFSTLFSPETGVEAKDVKGHLSGAMAAWFWVHYCSRQPLMWVWLISMWVTPWAKLSL